MGTQGIERGGTFVDVANDAVLVDDERDAVGEEVGEIQDAVGLRDLFIGVAQQRKAGAGFLGEFAVSLAAIGADPQHLGARGLKLGDITLIRLDLLRSTRR